MFQPERLTLARQRRGLNFTKLAKLVRMTAKTISAYEQGVREPTSDALDALASALHFPIEFFMTELGDVIPADAASFRSLSRMTVSQQDRALAAGTLCVGLQAWLSERFELPAADLPDLSDGQRDPVGAAAAVRAAWTLGDHPIANLTQLVEAHGVRVFSLADDCHEVDAFSFWHDGLPYACVGTHKTSERGIFDLAHELAHLVLHRDHSAPRGRDEEREANAFAAAFLMPEADVRAHALGFPTFRDLVAMKRRWRVSAAALNYRMHTLGLIDHWHYQSLCVDIARYGRDREIESVDRERSALLAQVLDLLREDGISHSAIASELHVPLSDLNELTFGLMLQALDGDGRGTPRRARPHLELVQPAS